MVIIDKEKCIGCGQCVKDCVAQNLKIRDGKADVIKNCLQCGHCVAICSCNAVSIPEYDMEDIEEVSKITLGPKELLGYIKSRRSIRDFKPDKISADDLLLLAEAGRYSATANNGQFHKYVFVQDELSTLKDMVWNYINDMGKENAKDLAEYYVYKSFYKRMIKNPADDYLFRNAPVVAFIASERLLDSGMVIQNMELMANTMGIGVLYNGFLARIADDNTELKKWLGIEDKKICACMLLGYPNVKYVRTAPRKEAEVTIL